MAGYDQRRVLEAVAGLYRDLSAVLDMLAEIQRDLLAVNPEAEWGDWERIKQAVDEAEVTIAHAIEEIGAQLCPRASRFGLPPGCDVEPLSPLLLHCIGF